MKDITFKFFFILVLLIGGGFFLKDYRWKVFEKKTLATTSFIECNEKYDLISDGIINTQDIQQVIICLGKRDDPSCLSVDFNHDTIVDKKDLNLITQCLRERVRVIPSPISSLGNKQQKDILTKLLNFIDFPDLNLTEIEKNQNLVKTEIKPGYKEILINDQEGKPLLARVFVSMGLKPLEELGLIGNWIYFVKGKTGVTIIDAGAYYPITSLITAGLDLSAVPSILEMIRNDNLDFNQLMKAIDPKRRCLPLPINPSQPAVSPLKENIDYIVKALNEFFPKEQVKEIIITHWHWDHAEGAPFLQKELEKRQGKTPLLRINLPDKYFPDADGSVSGAEKIFTDECLSQNSWRWGIDLKDGEELDGSGLKVIFTPGHTFGFVSFINSVNKYAITGPSILNCQTPQTQLTLSSINEDPGQEKQSCQKFWAFVSSDFKIYSLHLSSSQSQSSSWLGKSITTLREISWVKEHKYVDCPQHNPDRIWPDEGIISFIDCLIPDQMSGPSDKDKSIVPEPENLYYKHLSPSDMITALPQNFYQQILDRINDKNINTLKNLLDLIISYFKKNPQNFAKVSLNSLMIGVEGGPNNSKSIIKSASLMVHPDFERLISQAIGIKNRVANLYLPFVESVIGKKVEITPISQLYEAALNHCGAKAINGDQSGLGKKYEVDNYTIAVQLWPGRDNSGDCNLHIVEKSPTKITPAPQFCQKSQKQKGDANCDGKIDFADYEIWEDEFVGILSTKTADFNEDGKVTLTDFEIWRKNYYGGKIIWN